MFCLIPWLHRAPNLLLITPKIFLFFSFIHKRIMTYIMDTWISIWQTTEIINAQPTNTRECSIWVSGVFGMGLQVDYKQLQTTRSVRYWDCWRKSTIDSMCNLQKWFDRERLLEQLLFYERSRSEPLSVGAGRSTFVALQTQTHKKLIYFIFRSLIIPTTQDWIKLTIFRP